MVRIERRQGRRRRIGDEPGPVVVTITVLALVAFLMGWFAHMLMRALW